MRYLTLLVFSKWMYSRRSLDNGRIGVLRHDQFKQELKLFIAGQGTVVLVVGIIGFGERSELSNDLFHLYGRISRTCGARVAVVIHLGKGSKLPA